jgi:glucokinase
VDSVSGYVRNAVNLGWQSVDLRGGLRSRVGDSVPVYMQKDANALALGELVYGAAQGCTDFVYVAVGTGLGGGAITGGQVITGATFFPTEIGHLSLDPKGRLCGCGLRGCPEMYISGVGFRAAVLEYRGAYPHSPLATLEAPTAADVLRAAEQSDPLALRVLSEGGQWLGAIIACCAGILNPELVVLGGGLGLAAASYLLPEAEKELRRRVLPPTSDGLRFALSEVKESALGAAALVWHELDSR